MLDYKLSYMAIFYDKSVTAAEKNNHSKSQQTTEAELFLYFDGCSI